MAEEVVYVVRDSNEDLLLYLDSRGGLHAEVKQGAAPSILPDGPLTLLLRDKVSEVDKDDDNYIEALLKHIYDQGFYVDEIFIEVEEESTDTP